MVKIEVKLLSFSFDKEETSLGQKLVAKRKKFVMAEQTFLFHLKPS